MKLSSKLKQKRRKEDQSIRWSKRPVRAAPKVDPFQPAMAMAMAMAAASIMKKSADQPLIQDFILARPDHFRK